MLVQPWFGVVYIVFGFVAMCVQCDHFRGGTISWRANAGNKLVDFRYRLAFELGKGPGCNETLLGQAVSRLPNDFWTCSVGCPSVKNISDVNYMCGSVDTLQTWEQGEDNFKYTFPTTGPFTVSYTGRTWLTVDYGQSRDYTLLTTGDLRTRSDTNKPNSSPITGSMPIYEVPFGCKTTLQIPVMDPDDDVTICRWATGSECGSDCQSLPNSTLTQLTCTVEIEPTVQNGFVEDGWYKVLLTMEDLPRNDIYLDATLVSRSQILSSVPLQFVLHTKKIGLASPCTSSPLITSPTPSYGITILVPSNETLSLKLYAKSTSPGTRVKEFLVSTPYGLTLSSLAPYGNSTDTWYTELSWKPHPSQFGENLFCFQAVDTNNMTSDQRCFILVAEAVHPCDSGPCQNHGSCSLNLDTYECSCQPGFAGKACENDIDECVAAPCTNGGTCWDRVAGYVCFCPTGFAGDQCQDTDNCVVDPCLNFGTCITSSSGYNCTCLNGYTGHQCQNEQNECNWNPCEHGGTCVDLVGDFLCRCTAKYTGKICETEIDYCHPNPCQNRGRCTSYGSSYKCACPSDYLGLNCETHQDQSCSDPEDSYCLCNVDGKPVKVAFPEAMTDGLNKDDLIAGVIGYPVGAAVGAILVALWHYFVRPRCIQPNNRKSFGRSHPAQRPGSSASTTSLIGRTSSVSTSDIDPAASSPTPLNVYRAGFNDPIAHKAGERLNNNSYPDGSGDWL